VDGGNGLSPTNGPVFVVGDVHGYYVELVTALHRAGLVSPGGDWTGGNAQLWFLGDLVDRGPDGLGVVELIMRLVGQASGQGGRVETLLGNHEVLLLGMHHFGDTPVPGGDGLRSFALSWERNGGQRSDQDRVTEEHVRWLTARPVAAVVSDHLLIHSDTTAYLEWGNTPDEVNAALCDVLSTPDLSNWWECWRLMTTRFAFRGADGAAVAADLLARLGGQCVVHGHSPIPGQLGIPPAAVIGPHLYAAGRAMAVDGGLCDGGPCLVTPLPLAQLEAAAG
jgi:hypothetical protein